MPLLLEVNAPLAEERARFGGLRLRRLARWSENFVWRRAGRVLPVTEVLAGASAAAGVPRDRIDGDPERHRARAISGTGGRRATRDSEPLVLGFVGFVREWHGLDAVVRGIAGLARAGRPCRCWWWATGPARPGLEELAAELGIADRVRFTGLAAREAVPALIASFDIALQPASVPYASPLKVFEYMAAGRAIVAPDQPNLREVLEDGRTGAAVRPGRPGCVLERGDAARADAGLRAPPWRAAARARCCGATSPGPAMRAASWRWRRPRCSAAGTRHAWADTAARAGDAADAVAAASRHFADIQDREHVDADHVEIVGDVDALVRHGVVAPARPADDALHPRCVLEMAGVGAVITRRA